MEPLNTWDRIQQIYEEAKAARPAERAALVRARCGDDEGAREQVMTLLRASEKMGAFLEAPLVDFRGQSFGAYRAVEEIGRGGMSVVYRGERAAGDFDKQVAIKVILLQAAAMRAGEVEILAGLEHANIARLLDAGTTALGFRYLVMEYVAGVAVTRYAEGLAREEKIRLFLQICAGVQAAHRSLVVHRDLKPDNVLVTAGGRGEAAGFRHCEDAGAGGGRGADGGGAGVHVGLRESGADTGPGGDDGGGRVFAGGDAERDADGSGAEDAGGAEPGGGGGAGEEGGTAGNGD